MNLILLTTILEKMSFIEFASFCILLGTLTTMLWGLFSFINSNRVELSKLNTKIERLAKTASFTQRLNDSRLKGIERFLIAKHGYHQRDDDRNSGADFLDIE